MATNLPCDNHPDTQANMLITNLENGDTLTLCAFCIGQWARMLVGAFGEADDVGEEPTTEPQEVADLEPAEPGPDAEPKSGRLDESEEATEGTYPPPTPQETEAAGE